MPILQVKNWSEFQHYKERNPVWIKLHRKLLDDFEFHRLPLASRALAPMIWLLAAESKDGSFDGDPDKLAFRLHCTKHEIVEALNPLISSGFIVNMDNASESLAGVKHDAIPETETETETELPLTPSKEGEPKKRKRIRRNRTEILAPYAAEVGKIVNIVVPQWPKSQPGDHTDINIDVPMLARNVDKALRTDGATPEILLKAAGMYLGESKRYYKAPQFFFGAGNGESAHWLTYAKMVVHNDKANGHEPQPRLPEIGNPTPESGARAAGAGR